MNIVKNIAILVLYLFVCGCSEPAQSPVEGYLAGAGGTKLYFKTIGVGEDTIVVVQGGPGAGMNSVLPSLIPLAQHFVLVLYDQRGGGRSELPTDTSQLKAHYFIEDLEAVRKFFKLNKMNLLTHSFGSVLVASYGRKYPGQIQRIVFHGATGPRRSQAAKIYQKKAELSDTTMLKQSYKLLYMLLNGTAADPLAACRDYEAITQKLAEYRGEFGKPMGSTCFDSPEAVRYYYRYTAQLTPRSFGNWDFTTGLEAVSAPVLVVFGQNDTLEIAAQREWRQSLPNSRLLLVPDAWKGALADNPDFVVAAINTYFRGNWPKTVQ